MTATAIVKFSLLLYGSVHWYGVRKRALVRYISMVLAGNKKLIEVNESLNNFLFQFRSQLYFNHAWMQGLLNKKYTGKI